MNTNDIRTIPLGAVDGITGHLEVDQNSRALALLVETPASLTLKAGRSHGTGPTIKRQLEAGAHRIEIEPPVPVELLPDGRVRGLRVELTNTRTLPRATRGSTESTESS